MTGEQGGRRVGAREPNLPFFFFSVFLGAALRVVFSLGMVLVDVLLLGVSWVVVEKKESEGGRKQNEGGEVSNTDACTTDQCGE